jgi:hypothetical protein
MDPIREYAYIAGAVLLIAFGIYTFHKIEMIGENKVVAAQKADDEREAAHVQQVQHDADAKYAVLEAQLAASLAAPPRPGAIALRMCQHASVPASAPGTAAAAQPGSDATGGSGVGVSGDLTEGPDVTPDIEALLTRLGAKLTYLQGYVSDCQAAGLCQK